jgi:UPF0271 protein
MKTIDINCDMGESFGNYRLGRDEDIIHHITSANIACAWHAGDPGTMDRTVALALKNNVAAGAHPGYPDLMGFGRRRLDCTPQEIRQYVAYQVGALQAFCKAHNTRLRHVKPHGALYHRAVADEAAARAIAKAVMDVDPGLCYVALAGEKGRTMARVGREMGLAVKYEAFPDRAYTPGGVLLSRQSPGAVIKEPAEVAERALEMVLEGRVKTVDGSSTALKVDTLCVHGDTPGAVELAKAINIAMQAAGVSLMAMGTRHTPES